MRRLTLIALVSSIAVAVASCTSEEASVAPSPSPSPEVAAPAKSPTAQTFAKPLVAQKPASSVSGLLQSTNPNERAKQVQANINAEKIKVQKTISKNKDRDPFEGAPPPIPNPRPSVAPTQAPVSQTVPSLPPTRRPIVGTPLPPQTIATRPPRPTTPYPSSARPGGRPVAIRPSSPLPRPSGSAPSATAPGSSVPKATGESAPIAKIPDPPDTTNANGIAITGVVQVGNEPQAIVQAPNEPSRYVRVGQRIANGQVLVKRIEMNTGAEPVVVLEENGVEVDRPVGSGGAPTQATT